MLMICNISFWSGYIVLPLFYGNDAPMRYMKKIFK